MQFTRFVLALVAFGAFAVAAPSANIERAPEAIAENSAADSIERSL